MIICNFIKSPIHDNVTTTEQIKTVVTKVQNTSMLEFKETSMLEFDFFEFVRLVVWQLNNLMLKGRRALHVMFSKVC